MRQLVDQSEAGEEHKRIERMKLDALLGWCEVTACRRRALLEYFGDALPDDCGNCDICLTPPKTWDGTVEAQKLPVLRLPHRAALRRRARDRRAARQGTRRRCAATAMNASALSVSARTAPWPSGDPFFAR